MRIRSLVLAASLFLLALHPARINAATEDIDSGQPASTQIVPPDDPAEIMDPLGDAIVEKASIELRTKIIELRNAVQEHPTDPTLRIDLARGLMEAGAYGEAEAHARFALSLGGSDDVVTPLLIRAMFEQQKFSVLVQIIRKGSRPPKAEAEVRALLARAHLALGETGFVEPLIDDAQRLDPGGLPVILAMTQLLLSRNDIPGASADLARARAIAPDDLEVLRFEAQIDILKGDLAGALAACDTILARWPYDIQGLVLRASLRIDAGKFDDARSDTDNLLQAAPYLLVARYIDALLLTQSGDLATASERLMRVSVDFDTLPEGYYLQAIVETKRGRLDSAIDAIYNFISRRPNDGRGPRFEAIIALKENNPLRAIGSLQAAVDAEPSDGLAATILARAFMLQHDDDNAFHYFDRAGAAVAAGATAARKGTANALDVGLNLTVDSVDELTRSVLDADSVAVVSMISDVKLGAMTSALTKAEAFDQRKSSDPIARDWLGIIQMRQQHYDEAAATFAALVDREPKFLDARRNLARAYAAAGKPDAAEQTWKAVLVRAPNDEQTDLGRAEIAFKAGDAAKGAAFLEDAQRDLPDDPTPGLNAVRLYASLNNWKKAVAFSRVLLSIFPGNANVLNVGADIFAQSGDFAGAKGLYTDFLRTRPDSSPALAGEAKLLAGAGYNPAARDALVRAAAASPNDFAYMEALVDFDDATKGHDEAVKTARSLAPRDAVASALLSAQILLKSDRLKDAIAELKTTLAGHPDAKLVILLAQLQSTSGDNAAAEATIQSWLADHPQDWQARTQLGNLYMARQATDEAMATYVEVATAMPEDATILNNLAWIGAMKSDPRALSWAERAYYLAPSSETSDTYGWLLTRSGHADTGLPLLQNALAADPGNPSLQYHVAAALNAAGQKDAAKTLLAQALGSGNQFDGRSDAAALLATLKPD